MVAAKSADDVSAAAVASEKEVNQSSKKAATIPAENMPAMPAPAHKAEQPKASEKNC